MIPVWKSNTQKGYYWNPEQGDIQLPDHLTLVPTGDARLTRKVKPFAKYVLLENNGFGNQRMGYFADREVVEKIKSEIQNIPSPQERRFKRFSRKYHDWRNAIPDACDAMFNLNRYAKYSRCTNEHREEIYKLKNRFIKLLYELGYCKTVILHSEEIPPKVCWRCDGEGIDLKGFGECPRCYGSGWYVEPGLTRDYLCFYFEVNGQNYSWHQPYEHVDFPVQFADAKTIDTGFVETKPIHLRPKKFAEAKDLIRWVLQEYQREMQKHGKKGYESGSSKTEALAHIVN